MRWLPVACTVVVAFTAYSLLTGQDWLGRAAPVVLVPLGNLAAWALFGALAVVGWWPHRAGAGFRRLALTTIGAAALWLPLSIALAGNELLNFPQRPVAFEFWRLYSLALVFLPALLLAVAATRSLLAIRR